MAKRIGVLITALCLLLGQSMAFAESNNVDTDLVSMTMVEETWYNAFGVATNGQINNKSTIVTKKKVTKDDGTEQIIESTTTSESTITSSWMGGGLKAETIHSTTHTEGTDGSYSDSTADTVYTYDGSGRLAGASGTATSTSVNEKGEVTTTTTTTTYEIRNGEALEMSSHTTGTTTGVDGTVIATIDVSSKNTWKLEGGKWVLASTYTRSMTTGQGAYAGTYTKTERTVTYNTNGSGVVIGMSVSMEGRRTIQNGVGGFVNQCITGYSYTVGYDQQMGYFISWDKVTWGLDPSRP